MTFKEHYLRGDCCMDMIDDYVEMWHGEGDIKKRLSEFLGLSQEEYICWLISSNEELAKMLKAEHKLPALPYHAKQVPWIDLKEQLERTVSQLLSGSYSVDLLHFGGSNWQMRIALPGEVDYQESIRICRTLRLQRLESEHFMTYEAVDNEHLNALLSKVVGFPVISNHADDSGVWLLSEATYMMSGEQVQGLLRTFEQRLRQEMAGPNYKPVTPDTACHQLYGFKVALTMLGLLPESKCYVCPNHFSQAHTELQTTAAEDVQSSTEVKQQ